MQMTKSNKILRDVLQIVLLYVIYLSGELVQQLLHLPVPGSIVGLLILLVLLLTGILPLRWVEQGASRLLQYLPLFFIPATVGIVNHLELFSGKGLILIGIIIVSTVLTAGCGGYVSQRLSLFRLKEGE